MANLCQTLQYIANIHKCCLKLYSVKKEALYQPCPEAVLTSLGLEASGMDSRTVKMYNVVRQRSI